MKELLKLADIEIGGSRPWDIQVHNPALYKRILAQGTLGIGEAYMDGWWDCDAIDELMKKVVEAQLEKKIKIGNFAFDILMARIFNRQTKDRAFEVGQKHYDIGNDLYIRMLDKRMCYTCGYWANANNLDEAQEAKLDLVCKKIGLKKGDRILDIGCGWGNVAKFIAEKYGAEVVGITVSKEQVALAQELCKGLPVEIRLQDYRDVNPSEILVREYSPQVGAGEKFDHIISLGMFEHVGVKNHRDYMEMANRCLKDGGFFLLHTIGGNTSVSTTDPWMGKYIFPNSMLPSIAQIGKSIEGLFVMEDWHNFGADYDKTLMCWYKNFNDHWDEIKDKYGDRFYRMWRFYLLVCAGNFRARKGTQLWQIVLSKGGVKGGYKSVR